jgi:hypothetical protein
VEIAQDEHGRYSLNDMHRAAMAAGSATESQRPGEFLRSAGVQAFLSVLDTDAGIHASVSSIKGGPNQGTYGARLVVLRYAAWIAPTFEVQVYQCFDDMTRGKAPGYRLDDHTRRVRDVLGIAELAIKAQGLRGAAGHVGELVEFLASVSTLQHGRSAGRADPVAFVPGAGSRFPVVAGACTLAPGAAHRRYGFGDPVAKAQHPRQSRFFCAR